MLPPDGWQYSDLTPSRHQTLQEQLPLECLIGDMLAHSALCGVDVCEPCDEAKLEKVFANRVSFQLQPNTSSAHDALDRLLNGAFGLRARYCLSPEEGSCATAFVCGAIADAILERKIGLVRGVSNLQLTALAQAMVHSLLRPSAKVWFDPPTDKRAAALDDGHVLSAIWDRSRRQPPLVEAALADLSPQQIEASLAKGRTVPLPALLDVKGAFVTAEGSEYIPRSKRTRALQIHLMVWT